MTKQPDDKQRDWDKELAEVDRLLAKLPHADPTLGKGTKHAPPAHGGGGAGAGGKPGAGWHALAQAHPAQPAAESGPVGVWVRVGLGLAIGLAMTQWPYNNSCGFKLWFYLLGVGAVLAAGFWGAISSWRRRMGLPHVLSLGLVAWGFILTAGVILPRSGYAKNPATWFCP